MSTPEYCTLDGDPGTSVHPYVPTVDDMGGAAFVDDDVDPPEPEENVMSRDINQMQELLVRACKMMPKASFEVRYTSAGVLEIFGFKSCNSLFLSSQIILTPSSPYGFSLKWPRYLLPVGVVGPLITPSYAYVLDSGSADLSFWMRVQQSTDVTYAYATVVFMTLGGSPVTTAFTGRIDVDGEGNFST